ncbi:MAG TPA: hypothetical protein VM408_01480 [Methylomirabilota bacterium]|nr:hypothetical protein [Methylomirabilota bacterium]
MRTFVRTLAATAILMALVLGTAVSSVLAASPTGNSATVARYDYDEAWCFDYGTSYDCSVVDAFLTVTVTPDGRETGRIHFRMNVQSFDPSGVQIGSSRTVSFDKSVFADGGQDKTFSVSHTRAVGDFGKCVSTYILKIVDYELQSEKFVGPGCH